MNKNSTLRKIFLFLSITIAGLLQSQKSTASHGMGGEITWTCTPTGEFIFEMKFYRDCNGIDLPNTMLLSTNAPIGSITCTLAGQNDISPDGFTSNGDTLCPSCAQGNATTPIAGLIEELVYRSAPVSIPGNPPATGWIFFYGSCCRSATLANITGSGSIGFRNRAVMYPYIGTNTMPCFDSSPYFAEKPAAIFCTGYPFKYNPNAVDPELDSLVYSWGSPLDDFGAAIPFAPGYFINSQLPSTTQDPSNVPAALNSVSGEVSGTSFTAGNFATVIKVEAYKCGIKVAEIFREINVVLNNNCPNVMTGPNLPPVMNAPFNDPITGLQTSYSDTVLAGDTVNFTLQISDFDIFTNGSSQAITLEASGGQFGINFLDPDSGCVLPPCATLSTSLPTTFLIGGQISFNWITACDHVTGINPLCDNPATTYHFVIRAHDNYCPANATALATISVTVVGERPTLTATGPPTICLGDTVILTASGAQTYTWNTGQTGNTIVVTQAGTYSVTGITPGVCAGTTDIIIPPGTIPNVTASAPITTMCINWPLVTMTGTPAGGYWSGPGTTGNLFHPSLAGAGLHDIVYLLTDSMGCIGGDTLKMVVNLCTDLEEVENESGIFVYPNPATDQITLMISNRKSQKTKVELFNIYGQKVMDIFDGKIEQQHWEQTIDISRLNEGMYIFRLNGASMQHSVFVK